MTVPFTRRLPNVHNFLSKERQAGATATGEGCTCGVSGFLWDFAMAN